MTLNTTRKIEIIQNNRGFTLIEILISIGIFAIGFLAVGLMQISALNTTNSARRTTEALTLAENQAEMLRALPFYIEGTDYNAPADLTAGNHTAPADNTPFTVRWTVTNDVPLPPHSTFVKTTSGGVPVTRSKTIRVWVTPDNNANDIQAELEFARFCEKCNV